MKSIDIKSLLIGILGTALVMVLMGQASSNEQVKLLLDAIKYDVECVSEYKTNLDGTYTGEIKDIYCKMFDVTAPFEPAMHKRKGAVYSSTDEFYRKKGQ